MIRSNLNEMPLRANKINISSQNTVTRLKNIGYVMRAESFMKTTTKIMNE